MSTGAGSQAGPAPEGGDKGSVLLSLVIMGALLFASGVNLTLAGRSTSGWAWVLGLAAASLVIFVGWRNVALPITPWLPWVTLLVVYAAGSGAYALQSSAQLLCPLLVGLAASCKRPDTTQLERINQLMRWSGAALLCIIVFLHVPVLLSGELPEATGLAPQTIAALVFQSFFLCSYFASGKRFDLVLYVAFCLLPFVALTRGAMIATLAIALFTPARLPLLHRAVLSLAALLLFAFFFQTERVQHKMFWSGQGSISDLKWSNPDLRKSGRDTVSSLLGERIPERPWLGHGANAFLQEFRDQGIDLEQPHNDWLRLLYCYGCVGLALYCVGLIGLSAHAWKMSQSATGHACTFLLAGVSSVVGQICIMWTDNALIYAQYFGNLQFLLLGLGYGAVALQNNPVFEDAVETPGASTSTRGSRWRDRERKPKWRQAANYRKAKPAAAHPSTKEPCEVQQPHS